MADINKNNKARPEHIEAIIEVLKKPQDWTQAKVQKKFDELGFDFPSTEEQLEEFNKKFRDYPHKLDGSEIDPMKIINSIKQ